MIEGVILPRTLLLDLETTRSGRIRHIGAVYNETVFEKKKNAYARDAIETLDEMASAADFILGHNLLGHDFPILQTAAPNLGILKKPVIDTLYLSPLAFPQNPYHRLVKNYKLVRASINDPVADARLAASVFRDQIRNFEAVYRKSSRQIAFYHFCFAKTLFNGFSGKGLAEVFKTVSSDTEALFQDALEFFINDTIEIVCRDSALEFVPDILKDPQRRPMLAYCLAWLQVSGSNSVLPPWVRYRFPEISSILKRLRDDACGKSCCRYCSENHDPDRQLKRFFGFGRFREKPADSKGGSLQRAIVMDGMKDLPLIAILPTGGGKSLCYQLPALIRHWRRGLLTVVISPLQALMKDQVDNLVKNTGTPFAEAIYGLLTPPERGAALERVRLGDVALLYIAPEQLRSPSVRNVLKQREIGCWVFDEAHCLSKWGHAFRPDYLYAARFIREFCKENQQMLPPVCGYTATAKVDVVDELTFHFRDTLGQDLKVFNSSVERENLTFEIVPVSEAEKFEKTLEHINERVAAEDPGSAVVYSATRKGAEAVKEFLNQQGIAAEAFHGGLEPNQKRDIIEAFVNSEVAVISATNAFGMGVDKANIRLVVHFDMPGSLENYIQEAGRAGRDQAPARCVLLYSPEDANRQFGLGAMSEIKKREIERILRALRRVKRNEKDEIVITTDELLRDEELADVLDMKFEIRDTKVKTAISWLERAGFLKRNHNLTDVFQGKPLVATIEEAQKIINQLKLHPSRERLWMGILRLIFNASSEKGVRADAIAEGLFRDEGYIRRMESSTGLKPSQIIINAANQFIKRNKDRMKTDYPIKINRDREKSQYGGRWHERDPVSKGRVQIFSVKDPFHQALAVLKEIERIRGLSADFRFADCAILSRTRKYMSLMRSVCEQKGYPVKITLEKNFPVYRVREVVHQNHSIHRHLRELDLDAEVFFVNNNGHVEIRDRDDVCICRLSRKAAGVWRERLNRIHQIRVVSMLSRTSADPDATYRNNIRTEKWELPIVEVLYN